MHEQTRPAAGTFELNRRRCAGSEWSGLRSIQGERTTCSRLSTLSVADCPITSKVTEHTSSAPHRRPLCSISCRTGPPHSTHDCWSPHDRMVLFMHAWHHPKCTRCMLGAKGFCSANLASAEHLLSRHIPLGNSSKGSVLLGRVVFRRQIRDKA